MSFSFVGQTILFTSIVIVLTAKKSSVALWQQHTTASKEKKRTVIDLVHMGTSDLVFKKNQNSYF
jgi:hypothetical protein